MSDDWLVLIDLSLVKRKCQLPEQDVSRGLNARLASQDDSLTVEEIGVLVDTFPGQPLDFFGAIRCSMRLARLQSPCCLVLAALQCG